jgi:hypothetical protein
LALPWLEAMAPRPAHASKPPKRYVTFFSPNGTIRSAWVPQGTETQWELSRILAPLKDHQSDLVVIDGVDNVAAGRGPGDDHMRGMGCMLTGTELLPGTTRGGGGTPAGLAGGISLDQELVKQLKPPTKFPSLELGVNSGSSGTVWGYASYKGPGQPLPLDNSPLNVFNRVFAEVSDKPGDQSLFMRARQQRLSVVDGVLKQFKLLNDKLGASDKQRLDQHMTTVSELEHRLKNASTAPVTASCVRPGEPMRFDYRANDRVPETGKLQMDLLVLALQCDLTRVATLQWSHSVGGTRFSWLGLSRGHHDLSHDPDSNEESKEALTKINVWYAEQLSYLLTKMKEVKEADGSTLLDNSLVFWCNELSRGNAHSHPDHPYVLAGKAGGAVRTGRFLSGYGREPHNNLLVSILNAFGVQTNTFGNPAYCTGPLARF